MPKFISLANIQGGQTLFLRDQIGAVEDQMGQTKLLFVDGSAEIVLENATTVATSLGFSHRFPLKMGDLWSDASRITRMQSAIGGDAEVFFGKSKVEIDKAMAQSLAPILAAL